MCSRHKYPPRLVPANSGYSLADPLNGSLKATPLNFIFHRKLLNNIWDVIQLLLLLFIVSKCTLVNSPKLSSDVNPIVADTLFISPLVSIETTLLMVYKADVSYQPNISQFIICSRSLTDLQKIRDLLQDG